LIQLKNFGKIAASKTKIFYIWSLTILILKIIIYKFILTNY